MTDKNDPRVRKMVEAWLEHAKQRGFSTEQQDGQQPEDTDVLEFVVQYLNDTYSISLTGKGERSLQALVVQAPAAPTNVSNDYLNRVKDVINKKLSPAQKQQLKRELSRG